MSFTIDALDEEFAVSTGSNVNDGPGTSTFDYPPTSSSNLTITANSGDTSPGTFSVGDTYDIVYGNGGGGKGGTFEDATVVRSDALPGGGHAVVFEGLNQDGDLEQIVWTPSFDLESWYFDNFNQGSSPGFYTADQDPGTEYASSYVCFSSETYLNTANGEVLAGRLKVGDRLLTLDRGYQPILWIGRRLMPVDQSSPGRQPVIIQPNAFRDGTVRHPVVVSPQHRILLRDANKQEVLAPAKALVGMTGIRFQRGRDTIEYCSFLLSQHELLDASGLVAESFFVGTEAIKSLSSRELKLLDQLGKQRSKIASKPTRRCLGGSSAARAVAAGATLARFETQHAAFEPAAC